MSTMFTACHVGSNESLNLCYPLPDIHPAFLMIVVSIDLYLSVLLVLLFALNERLCRVGARLSSSHVPGATETISI